MKRAAYGALLALAACSPGQPYRPPALPIAPAWRASGATAATPPTSPWWQGFGDAALDSLEQQAMAANLTIEQVLARVDQANAAARGARANTGPTGDIGGSVSQYQQSLNAGTGQISRYVSFYPRGATEETPAVTASWDLDFAGNLRRQNEMARANLAGARAQVAAARIAVAAELADAYAQWRGAMAQKAQADALVGFLGDQAAIMAVRVRTGAAAAQAQDASEARLADATATVAMLKAAAEAQRDRIAVLVGHPPGDRIAELDAAAAPAAAPLIAPPDPLLALPADVLRRRPDVAAAEARLIAAHAGVRASLAEYYPKLTLSGVLGLDSTSLSALPTGDSVFGQAAVGIHWRLFDFARIDAEVRDARGREREALAAYRETILNASEAVEVGFARLAAAHDRVRAYDRASAKTANSARISAKSYAAGALSRDSWIDARRDAAQAEAALATARQDENQAVIACYRALGI